MDLSRKGKTQNAQAKHTGQRDRGVDHVTLKATLEIRNVLSYFFYKSLLTSWNGDESKI